MKTSIKYFLFILFCLTLQNCTPLYIKYYNEAVDYNDKNMNNHVISYCISSIQENPDYVEAHILLEDAYERCIQENLFEIKKLKRNKPKFYWDRIYSFLYSNIQFNNQIINSNIKIRESLKRLIRENHFHYEIEEATNRAAEEHYNEGIRLSRLSGPDNQKNAAKQFAISLDYIADYRDAANLYNECKRKAIKRIAIIPFEDLTNKRGRYGGISDRIVDDIVSLLLNDTQASEFIELITRAQLEKVVSEQSISRSNLFDPNTAIRIGKILGVHEIIVGKITQIIYSPERISNRTINESKEVKVGEKIVGRYKDGSPRKEAVWGVIKVRVTIFKKISYAQIHGSYNIIDVETGIIKKSSSCYGKDEFIWEYGRFYGDERALSYNSQSLCKKGEEFAPVEEQLVSNALERLSNYLFSLLKEYTK